MYESTVRHRRIGLDLLRSLAIGGVLLSHGMQFLYAHVSWGGWLGHLGSFGVDLFFVLSGFLIGGILIRLGPALTEGRVVLGFWIRRWLRTLPNYWLFLVLNVPFMLFVWRLDVRIRSFFWEFPFFLQNFASREPPFFPEAWTLSVEEWFYLILPAMLWLGLKFTRRFDRVFLVSAFTLLFVPLGLRFAMAPPAIWAVDMRQVVIYRLDALMYGVLAAWMQARWPGALHRIRYPLLAAGFALVAWTYHGFYTLDLEHSRFARTWLSSLITLGMAGLLPWAHELRSLGSRLAEGAVRRVALWSYSMYLCNVPFNVALDKYLGASARASAGVGWAVFILYFVLTTGAAACVYNLYERRFLRLRDRIALCKEVEPA